jgi:hypothetical protein
MNLVPTLAALLCATLLAACAPTASKKDASQAATVAATAPVAAAAAAPAVVQEEEDRMICKMVIPTGSRIGTKACRRSSQWEQMTRDGRDAAERVQRMGNQKPIPNG